MSLIKWECVTWPASLFAQSYPFVIISKCEILIPDNSAGEARPTKNNNLPQLQGTPIRAVRSLAVQASILNGTCSQELCKCPCQHQGAPSPHGCRGADWPGWTPTGLGNVCSQPSPMSRWVALAKKVQCLALMFRDATAYRWHRPLLFQDINPLGRRPCHLYVLVLESWSLHDAEDGAVVSTPLASSRAFFML